MYGVQGIELEWFKLYVTTRKQMLKVNGVKSECINDEMEFHIRIHFRITTFSYIYQWYVKFVTKCEIIYAYDTLFFSGGHTGDNVRITW